jgi:ketosteroid isomerase-like protein
MAISDEMAITRLTHDYAAAVRAQDAAAWGATWADDAEWLLGPDRAVTGRDAIVEMWSAAMVRYHRVVQLYLSSWVDIDGDRAHGSIQFVELLEPVGESPRTMAAQYHDRYVRTADGWRYARRELDVWYVGGTDLAGRFFTPRFGD